MGIKNLILFLLPLIILQSCKESTIEPNWITYTNISGQSIVNIKGDTILFTELDNYSYYRDDLDELLQSDSVIIKFRTFKQTDYIPNKNLNELKIDSTTYLYSSINGNKHRQLTYYTPQRDLLRYFDDSCNGILKSFLIGCKSEYELSKNYKGCQLILTHKEKHFRDEIFRQKLSFLIYKDGKLIKKQKVANYNNIQYGYIQYFIVSDAVFFYHYNCDETNKKKERVLAKFSFDKLIDITE